MNAVSKGTLTCAILIVALSMTGPIAALAPQTPEQATNIDGKTVWAGVYTEAQAARGQTQYEASCSRCHREGPRTGEIFMRDWSGTDVEGLFRQIKTSMPAGAPSSLSDDVYLDLVAYILRANDFPAGRDELTTGIIKSIRIEGRNGPEPVPNFALASTVGCLGQRADGTWLLTDASEPIRTKNPAASTGDELKASESAGLGTHTFELLNVYPSPNPYKGHKIEAKGFLIRNPDGDRINVTAVQTLAARCDKTSP